MTVTNEKSYVVISLNILIHSALFKLILESSKLSLSLPSTPHPSLREFLSTFLVSYVRGYLGVVKKGDMIEAPPDAHTK